MTSVSILFLQIPCSLIMSSEWSGHDDITSFLQYGPSWYYAHIISHWRVFTSQHYSWITTV